MATLIQKVIQKTKRQTSEKLCHGTEDTMLLSKNLKVKVIKDLTARP